MTLTHEHVHHLAQRLHKAHAKIESMEGKLAAVAHHVLDNVEVAGGAWLGGAIEGYWDGKSLGPVPLNLLGGFALVALGTAVPKVPEKVKSHLANLGTGMIASYAAAVGYKVGDNWRRNGFHLWGAHSLSKPYSLPTGTKASGELDEAQMASIVAQMQQAAAPGM